MVSYHSLSFLFLISISKVKGTIDDQWANYHNQNELEIILTNINKRCPDHTTIYSIGKSVEGRDLLVIHFSTTPGQHQICMVTVLFLIDTVGCHKMIPYSISIIK